MYRNSYTFIFLLIIASCGGGGGGGGSPSTPSTPAPTVNLSAEPTSVLLESTSTLTWSSTNATSCSASWTSQTGTYGSEAVTITTAGNNSFSISCTGDGGSRSTSVTVEGYRETDGVVVDGYISGAEVCIDEDESWTCDSNENTTTSDNEGKFTIKYANGNLVSIGGTDLDSQTLLDNLLITHKLSGHSDFKAVTPVTSIAAFMEDASLVNAALGIDSSIDVFTFDPVANKGDGDVNDYLYEKGNQLTVLAYVLQNITNNLNTSTETTQDYFKAITEEIEKEYTETETKVDIETEAFVTKALENVITAKSVTIDQTAKANTTKALASILPVIEVKSSDDLTTGVIRFAVSTLQTDIQAIANGTATAETVSSYTEDILAYIAEDQNIDADEIAPDISAIADSASTTEDTELEINVLLNDSYVSGSPFSLLATNGTNGTTFISNNLITYSPDADYNGSDSFSYTITQGDKTSSADVTVTIEAVNDTPAIDIASTIQVEENQTAVTTVSVSDVDEDELTLTLGGTDADSFNLSDENVLTFIEAPDYETKDSYSITLTLTDGTETVTKDVSIVILDINYVFSGKVIDGYIDGAEIFIDQNFNFTKDDGEFSATSDTDGAFNIDISDESLAACLQKRPIIAEVPVGAIDSSLGEVSNAYQMILPSIEDSINANAAIYITPFTSLLSDAVIQGINASNIVDEIDASEGCGDLANSVALNISNELQQITNSIESSLDISFEDLLIDFIEDNSSSSITETSAQKLAAFFPYFKELSDEFDSELSDIHGEVINTKVIIEENAINSILSTSDIEEIPLSFNAIYETEPNDLGWFIQEKIRANGAKVKQDGQLKHYTCFTNSDNCITSSRTLDALRNASKRYTRTSTFLNNNYDPENYNYQLVIEDEQRVNFDINGNPKDRVCIYQNWLYLTPVNTKENFNTNDRYNTGVSDGSNDNDNCSDVLANKDEALFVALVDQYDDGTDFEEIDIRITNPIYQNSTFFENKVNNIYQNRNSLDLDPLIQEFASIPRDFKDIEVLRSKLTESSTDQISIFWTKRNASGQLLETAKIDIKFDKNNDYFEYGTHENSSTGSEYTIVSSTEGQQAINDIVNVLYSNSNVFNSSTYLSYAPIFSSESTFAVDENQTAIGTVTAVDGDDDEITFTISGDDISISAEGVLTFNTAPDFETKKSYTATVTASDGTNSTTQEITVNINNVNDVAPEFTSNATFTADENQTAIGLVTATDADGDGITFSISGSEINIDASTGTLTFVSAPDYETKSSYTATVTASDGLNSTDQDITVNVNDIFDNDGNPPVLSNLTASPSTVDVTTEAATITLSIDVTDESGVDVTQFLSKPQLNKTGSPTISADANWALVSGDDKDGTYQATVTVPTTTATGDYSINSGFIYDIYENQETTVTDAGAANGGVTINSSRESNSPVLSNLTASPSTVDVTTEAATITLSIDVTDESGVDVTQFLSKPQLNKTGSPTISADANWALVSGDDKDGTYQATVTVPTTTATGDYSINSGFIYDIYENQETTVTDAGAANGGVTITTNSSSETIYYLYGDSSQSTYLGCYGCGSASAESICNESGTYGSSVSASSIWNTVGTYGSTVGSNSPWNSVGTNPPEFFNNKEKASSYGKFTINTTTANRTNITKLTNILDFFNNSSSNHSATRNYACSSSQTSINVTFAANDNGSGNVYVINGEQKSSLTLERGKSYTFVHPSGHPFRFSQTADGTHGFGSEYTSDVAKSTGSTTIAVGSSTPSTLYYYCSIHSGMGGSITIN